jgi:hypothetical protein
MRLWAGWCWCVVASTTGACAAAELNVVDPTPTVIHELTGTIGTHAIRMHLSESALYRCADGELLYEIGTCYAGWYEYTKIRKRIDVRGCYNAQGMGGASEHPPVEIDEYVDGKNTGSFLTTQDDILTGRWQANDARSSQLPYRLHIVRDLDTPRKDSADDDARVCRQRASSSP